MPLPALPFAASDVPRVRCPSVEALAARRHQGPVVIEGCLAGWPLLADLRARASDEAKLAHLSGLVGHREITFAIAPSAKGSFGFDEDLEQPNFSLDGSGVVPFARFAERLARGGEVIYMQGKPVDATLPELSPALGGLPYLDRFDLFNEGRQPFSRSGFVLWIGSGGHVVNLHYDPGFNFMCLLEGTKRVTLFPPEALLDMHHGAFDRGVAGVPMSMSTLLAPDFARFPRLRAALGTARVAVLEPGDVLYVPPLWWHHVESFGLNIMVNVWLDEVCWDDVVRTIERGVATFADEPKSERARWRPSFRAVILREPGAHGPLDEGPADGAKSGVLGNADALAERLPAHWRRYLALAFDHFVFREKDPLGAVPGAYGRWADRCRERLRQFDERRART